MSRAFIDSTGNRSIQSLRFASFSQQIISHCACVGLILKNVSNVTIMQRKSNKNVKKPSSDVTECINYSRTLYQDKKNGTIVDNVAEEWLKNGLEKSEQNRLNNDSRKGERFGYWGILCNVSFVGVLKVVTLLVIIPPFLNYASLLKESASLHRHSAMHDGPRGNKLFMNCSGKGLPVVIMDAPGGHSSDVWALVQDEVAKFTKVCVYDRPGLGFSERVSQRFHGSQHKDTSSYVPDLKHEQLRPTSENMLVDIHHLVKTISKNINNVLLVGAGLGAVNVRFYTSFYENVFGIILINPFSEKLFTDQSWLSFWYDHFVPSLQMEQITAALGINRLGIITGLYNPNILKEVQFDDDVLIRLKHLSCKWQHLGAGVMEHYYINESLAQLKILQKLKPFPNAVSVNLISSRNFDSALPQSLNNLWFNNQELFAKGFPQSKQAIVDSDCNGVYFKNVKVIVKVIRKEVSKFRKSVKYSSNI